MKCTTKNTASKVVLLTVGLLIFVFNNVELWSDECQEIVRKPSYGLVDGKFMDCLMKYLEASFDDSLVYYGKWLGCSRCKELLDSMQQSMKLYNLRDSNQKRRVIQQVMDTYRILDSLGDKSLKIRSGGGGGGGGVFAIALFWNTYLSLVALKKEVIAVFQDGVPDNAELGVQLKRNIDEHTMIICQEIKEQRSILESRISGKINATHEALNCENESQTMVLDGRIAESEKRITDKLDELLKDRSEIATTSCVVIGLAYYASGVIGGLATWCPDLSSDISGTLTGEVLDYHEPATATSRIGLRLGIGGLIFKHYNISGGYIYFDDTLDPNGKRNAVHRIHISFDYWRSKDISLGIGYSALTGLGGRVLLGL